MGREALETVVRDRLLRATASLAPGWPGQARPWRGGGPGRGLAMGRVSIASWPPLRRWCGTACFGRRCPWPLDGRVRPGH